MVSCANDSSSGILNTLFGSFAGASAAFLFNGIHQRRIEKRDNLASGRLALLTVRAQFDDFLNYRWAIWVALDNQYRQVGEHAPEWALGKPMAYHFSDTRTFRFESLGFLLSTSRGTEAFQRLQVVERAYFDLSARHSDCNDSIKELQQKIALAPIELDTVSLGELELHVGPEIVARVVDQHRAVVLRIDRDEPLYSAASRALNEAMVERYGEEARLPQFDIPQKFQKASLPLLPPPLGKYLDTIPVEEFQ
jgi:hypothetical protein